MARTAPYASPRSCHSNPLSTSLLTDEQRAANRTLCDVFTSIAGDETTQRDVSQSVDVERIRRDREHNIFLLLLYTFITTIGFSISQWNIFDAYLQTLARSRGSKYSNSFVGIAESLSGFTSLLLAIPVGFIVDTYSRTKICRWSLTIGAVGTFWLGAGVVLDSVPLLFSALVVGGIFGEIASSASDAIFADSAEAGKRSQYFATKGILATGGLAIGPGIAAVLFCIVGDEWVLPVLHLPLLIGILLGPAGFILLLFLSEPHSEVILPPVAEGRSTVGSPVLPHFVAPALVETVSTSLPPTNYSSGDNSDIAGLSDGVTLPPPSFADDSVMRSPIQSPPPEDHLSHLFLTHWPSDAVSAGSALKKESPVGGLISAASPSISRPDLADAFPPTNTEELTNAIERDQRQAVVREGGEDGGSPTEKQTVVLLGEDELHDLTWQEKMIPFVVTISDVTRQIGGGMTTKFFPLFFINDYGFDPMRISLLYCAYPLSISTFIKLVQWCSRPFGRAQSVFLFQFVGIVVFVLMSFAQNIHLMVFLFLVRGGLMNAGFPIDRSIVNDYIPSRHRGKWNAVQSITAITWSGSALFGGFLSDTHDYRYTFLFTASIYTCALLMYIPLLWFVPREEGCGQVGKMVAIPVPPTPATPTVSSAAAKGLNVPLSSGTSEQSSFVLVSEVISSESSKAG